MAGLQLAQFPSVGILELDGCAAESIALSQTPNEVPAELLTDPLYCDYLPVSPLFKQRRWARISWQYWIEYRKEVRGLDAVRAVAAGPGR